MAPADAGLVSREAAVVTMVWEAAAEAAAVATQVVATELLLLVVVAVAVVVGTGCPAAVVARTEAGVDETVVAVVEAMVGGIGERVGAGLRVGSGCEAILTRVAGAVISDGAYPVAPCSTCYFRRRARRLERWRAWRRCTGCGC